MPDGSAKQVSLNDNILRWLQVGRTEKDISDFIEAAVRDGASAAEASRTVAAMLSGDRETENRIKQGWPPSLALEWTAACVQGGLSLYAAINLLARTGVRNGVRWIEHAHIVGEYRHAIRFEANAVVPDMPKAREIHKNILRAMRKPKLAQLDIDYMRAYEAGNTTLKAQITSQKQALRDVTSDPRIAAATTPEELKTVIPAVLT